MDKDRVKGSGQQAKGKVKEVAGKLTGDAKLESEGKADKAAAKFATLSVASRTRFAASSYQGVRSLDSSLAEAIAAQGLVLPCASLIAV